MTEPEGTFRTLLPTAMVERARAIGLGVVLSAHGIKLAGRGMSLSGPCPRCGGTDRFAVHLGKTVFHCRGCSGRGGDAIALVQFIDGCGFREAVEQLTGERSSPIDKSAPLKPLAATPTDDAKRARQAIEIFGAAQPIGDVAAKYLQRRGVARSALPADMTHALRWHPHCPWENETRPCLVALWTDALSNEPRAIHRRPITESGEAQDHWRALGPSAGCLIRLWPNDAVTQALVVGEGIETTAAAATRIIHRGTLLQPAWAAGDAGHMAALPLLAGVEALTLLVDHDANGAGQRAAAECARRWSDAGREVVRLTPRVEGRDFSDVVTTA